MGKYVAAGKTGEFKDGTSKKIAVEGKEIMLARVGNNYYAVSNRCTHMKGDLSAGTLEGTIVTCPRHGSQFDIRDGKNVRWLKGKGLVSAVGKVLKSPQALATYKVKVEGDTISVEV
ncbi:MAG: Rieske 2Fe-2S domain-containing protein [Dehalococcoidales bacterium]|nr:Rieske 2Fe-2S domain-containing protein [Dehalococcoidales bacterium]